MANSFVENVLAEFCPSGEYLAYSDNSGTLQIWETATGTKRQQFIQSSHLTASCSCLSWAPVKTSSYRVTPSKKKRRSRVENSIDQLELIAIGTAAGTVLLYSRATNDLHTQLTDGHVDRVNDACWDSDNETLFTCSSDEHIVEWSVSTSSVKRKWKADDGAVTSLCLCHTKHHLLSAGYSIKLWNLETLEVLQTFTGHNSQVYRLLQVPTHSRSNLSEDTTDINGSYVLSSAVGDRHISVWQISSSSSKKSVSKTIASLSLPESSVHMSICCRQHNQLQVEAVTTNGKLVLFEHVLNGHAGVLKPECVVEISSAAEDGSCLPVKSASFSSNAEGLTIAYGNESFIQPAFETLQLKELKLNHLNKKVSLLRQPPVATLVSMEVSHSKLKNPEVPDNVTVLRPCDIAPVSNDEETTTKRKRRHSLVMSVEERLNAMGVIDAVPLQKSVGQNQQPKTNSLATLLAQGLHSQDKKMLNNVLQNRDAEVMQQTILRLPLTSVVPLIKELSRRMGGHAQSALVTRMWLKCLISTHAAYLMTLPDRDNIMGPLHQMLETRLHVFRKVCHLQGRLDLIFSQIDSKSRQESWKAEPPQLSYQDESSDEDYEGGDRLHDIEMESEDEWEQESQENEDDESESSSGSDSDDASGSVDADDNEVAVDSEHNTAVNRLKDVDSNHVDDKDRKNYVKRRKRDKSD